MASSIIKVPAALDFKQLLSTHGSRGKHVTIDSMAYICHTIVHLQASYKEFRQDINSFINLNAEVLKACHSYYKENLDFLLHAGVLETDNRYIVNEKSRGYRFAGPYRAGLLKDHTLTQSKWLRKIHQDNKDKRVIEPNKCDGALHLLQPFDGLSIHANAAIKWIRHHAAWQQSRIKEGADAQELRMHSVYIHELYKLMAEGIQKREFNAKVDTTAGRFHSRLTNMKKELLNFLHYEGESLVSLDLKNSQPYFSLVLFDGNFYLPAKDTNQFALQNIYGELYEFLCDGRLLGLITSELAEITQTESFEDYRKCVLDGNLYERFTAMQPEKQSGVQLTRDKAKKMVYTIFFGDNSYLTNSKLYRLFESHFPGVVRLFKLLKSRRYNDLAILLQRIESTMIIKRITKGFHARFPQAPVFTIHDSILSTPAYVQAVQTEVSRQLEDLIGAAPKLTIKELTPQSAYEKMDMHEGGNIPDRSNEDWRQVIGFEDLYKINPKGQVMSLHSRNKGMLLKTRIDRAGYVTVRLSKNGQEHTFSLHRLLAMHFVYNPMPQKNCFVNHINGNKQDNCIYNLEWVSHSENMQHAFSMQLSKPVQRKPVINVCTGKTYQSAREAADAHNLPYSTCKNYLSGRRPNPTCLRLVA